VGAEVPFAYDDDERWVPVFPRENTALGGLSFRFSWLLARGRVGGFVPRAVDDEPSPRFSSGFWLDTAGTLSTAVVLVVAAPFDPRLAALPALVVGFAVWLLFVVLSPLQTSVSTVAPLDERSPDA